MFSEFDTVSKKEWLQKVEKDLKGKSIDTLDWNIDKQTYSAFYHSDDLQLTYGPAIVKKANTWKSGIIISEDNLTKANQLILRLLEYGAQSVCIRIEKACDLTALNELLKGVQLEWIDVHFDLCGPIAVGQFIKTFIEYIESSAFDARKVSVLLESEINNYSDFEKAIDFKKKLPNLKYVLRSAHESNGSGHQELSDILINFYNLTERDHSLSLSELSETLAIKVFVTDDFYISLAKLRALRLLFAHFINCYGITTGSTPVIIAYLYGTQLAEDVNTQRIALSTQLVTAVLGGADIVYSELSDATDGTDQRIALNIQNIAAMESFLDRVVDPVSGSYFFEEMTDRLCVKAWAEFQNSIESKQ